MKPLVKMLIEMGRFYREDLDQRQLEMYVNVLSQFPESAVLEAGRAYIRDPNNTRFPIPPHKIMVDHMPQKADVKDIARNTAMRIKESVSKFGWPNGEEARQYIGEEGWRCVLQMGGWNHLCENLGSSIPESMFIAQARDAIESNLRLQKAGIDPTQPAIEAKQSMGLQRAGDLLPSVLKKQGD